MNNDVTAEINAILMNIPENVSDLAKIRFIYLKLGKLFCYNLKVLDDVNEITKEIDFNNVNRNQTCIQIAKILNIIIKGMIPNIKCKIIPRTIDARGIQTANHVANDIEFTDSVTGINYRLLLDLTLDLYRIQSNLQTKQFGFTTDADNTYDIISLRECTILDETLGLMNEEDYLDKEIIEYKKHLNQMNLDIKNKVLKVWRKFGINFSGGQEAKLFANHLFTTIIENPYHEYNLYYHQGNDFRTITLFIFEGEPAEYFLLNNNFGLIESNPKSIKEMLSMGWSTNSTTLTNKINEDLKNSTDTVKKI